MFWSGLLEFVRHLDPISIFLGAGLGAALVGIMAALSAAEEESE